MNPPLTRRRFLGSTALAGAGVSLHLAQVPADGAEGVRPAGHSSVDKPALLGGQPVRTQPFPSWPRIDHRDDQALLDVLHSGKWFRGSGEAVNRFEAAYARLTGAKHCLATANGTSALLASLGALDVGPGDEVILPPYTFVATLNVILLQYALPVFVDSDPETFQIDARKIPEAITDRTAAIIPVHLGGSVADLDSVLKTAQQRNLPVIEDACQAHLAEWRGKPVGTWGRAGCFSFQASKNLNSGEGGAVLTNDSELAEKCYAFHNNCRARQTASYNFAYRGSRGANLRLTEFQAALLLSQMTRLEDQSKARERNAEYLTGLLREIPGILPARTHAGCTRNAYHLYMFRYRKEAFAGMERARFLQALGAEGIPGSGGYAPLNKEAFLKAALQTRGYRKIYPPELLDRWAARNECPENDRLCQEAVWFTQTMLLGSRTDMDHIAAAVRKIQAHAAELAKA